MSDCCRKKYRDEEEKALLVKRLNRIEGQIRGISKMLSDDAYCTDILIQVSAVKSALDSFNSALLEEHINTCVKDGIKKGDDEVIRDLVYTVKKLIK